MPDTGSEKKQNLQTERRATYRRSLAALNICGVIQPIEAFSDVILQEDTAMPCQLVDFSAEGYRVNVYAPIKMGTNVLISLHGIGPWDTGCGINETSFNRLSSCLNEANDVHCLGVVVWREGMDIDAGYQIGIHLTRASLQHRFHVCLNDIIP